MILNFDSHTPFRLLNNIGPLSLRLANYSLRLAFDAAQLDIVLISMVSTYLTSWFTIHSSALQGCVLKLLREGWWKVGNAWVAQDSTYMLIIVVNRHRPGIVRLYPFSHPCWAGTRIVRDKTVLFQTKYFQDLTISILRVARGHLSTKLASYLYNPNFDCNCKNLPKTWTPFT